MPRCGHNYKPTLNLVNLFFFYLIFIFCLCVCDTYTHTFFFSNTNNIKLNNTGTHSTLTNTHCCCFIFVKFTLVSIANSSVAPNNSIEQHLCMQHTQRPKMKIISIPPRQSGEAKEKGGRTRTQITFAHTNANRLCYWHLFNCSDIHHFL